MKEVALQWVVHHGYAGIFSLLVLGVVGLPIPDEWLLTAAGYFVFNHTLRFIPTLTSAFLGSICGITLSYILGRTFGAYLILRWGGRFRIGQNDLDRVHDWFGRIGRWTLTFGYFVPGVRHLTAYVAGATQVEIPIFAAFAYAGGFIWSLTFIAAGYFLGEESQAISHVIHNVSLVTGLIVATGLLTYMFVRKQRGA